jgi:hypothetical protein
MAHVGGKSVAEPAAVAVRRQPNAMVSLRNAFAVGLFLFGASYLWLTPAFLNRAGFQGTIVDPKGLLAVTAIVGFVAAAWGLFKDQGWWVPVAVASGLIGLASVIPYWIWALPTGGGNSSQMIENAVIHAAGGAVVALILLVPATERWLTGHL